MRSPGTRQALVFGGGDGRKPPGFPARQGCFALTMPELHSPDRPFASAHAFSEGGPAGGLGLRPCGGLTPATLFAGGAAAGFGFAMDALAPVCCRPRRSGAVALASPKRAPMGPPEGSSTRAFLLGSGRGGTELSGLFTPPAASPLAFPLALAVAALATGQSLALS